MTGSKLWRQSTVFGEKLPMSEDPLKPPEGCCSSCYLANEKVCRCTCRGAYHGLGRLNKRTRGDLEKPRREAKNRSESRKDKQWT
jgi:hypothetical protein